MYFSRAMRMQALAATIFHYKEITIHEVKDDLRQKGVEIR